jgi:hypothetical protein
MSLHLHHKKGDTFDAVPMEVKKNNVPMDLTGAVIKMQLRKSFNDIEAALTLTSVDNSGLTITNATAGQFKINAQIIDIPVFNYVYDIQFTFPDGTIDTFVKGNFNVAYVTNASVNINNIEPNVPIMAFPDSLTTSNNTTAVYLKPMDNDLVGNTPTKIVSIDKPGWTLGTLQIVQDGQAIKFTPNGTKSAQAFTYTIKDARGKMSSANYTINVPDNNLFASNFNVQTLGSIPASVLIEPLTSGNTDLGYEPTIISAINTTGFTLGTATIASNGLSITLNPNGTTTGDQSFTYTIKDSTNATSTGTINVSIPASSIDAINDTVTRLNDVGSFLYNPLGNDDLGYQNTNITAVNGTGFTLGTVSIHSGQQLINVVVNGNVGTSSFTYTLTDSTGAQDTATVEVTINEAEVECFNYTVSNFSSNPRTVTYTTCAGVVSQMTLSGNASQVSLGCVRKNSITGNSLIISVPEEEDACS